MIREQFVAKMSAKYPFLTSEEWGECFDIVKGGSKRALADFLMNHPRVFQVLMVVKEVLQATAP